MVSSTRGAEAPAQPLVQPQLRIIIPAKDEARRIRPPLERLCAYFGDQARITVVANGCTDDTASVVREVSSQYPNLSLLEVSEPIGKGGAVRLGMGCGNEPFLAYADADGSFDPGQIDRLYARCRESDVAGAIGSRRLRGASVGHRPPVGRRVASIVFRLLVRSLFGLRYSDSQCGVKVFRRDALDAVFGELELANFAFDVDLLLALDRKRMRVVEEPVAWEDVTSDSKVNIGRAGVSMVLSLLRLRLRRGIFRYLPFTELLASDAVIAVRPGCRVLLLAPPKTEYADEADVLVASLREAGYPVRVARPRGWVGAVAFVLRYIAIEHSKYDAILGCGNTGVLRLLRASTKPKFVARIGERDDSLTIVRYHRTMLAETFVGGLGELVAQHRGYRGSFRSVDGTWRLVPAGTTAHPVEIEAPKSPPF